LFHDRQQFFIVSEETAAALFCAFGYSTAGVKTSHCVSVSFDCMADMTACPPYTTVNHQWTSFSNRCCSYVEHAATSCHVFTVSASFCSRLRPTSSFVHFLDFCSSEVT